MSEYFEPVSVLSLGSVLGLGELDGDTLRRWFYGLAQGAINFEDDPARWAVSDATGAEIDRELAPILERLWEAPDASMIATMLQHAEGSFDERVAAVLPTLKVILLGGMQEPGMLPDRPSPGCSSPGQAAALAADPAGLVQRRGRGGPALGLADRDADPSRPRRDGARRRDAAGRRESRSARLVGQPRRGGLGADRRRVRPLPPDGATTLRSGSAPTSAPATTSRGCRCGSRSSGSSSGPDLRADDPTGRRVSTAGSSGRRSTFMSAGTRPDRTLHA